MSEATKKSLIIGESEAAKYASHIIHQTIKSLQSNQCGISHMDP